MGRRDSPRAPNPSSLLLKEMAVVEKNARYARRSLVFVNPLITWRHNPLITWRHNPHCHLWAISKEELEWFVVERLGLPVEPIHFDRGIGWHCDLSEAWRSAALEFGAIACDVKQAGILRQRLRPMST